MSPFLLEEGQGFASVHGHTVRVLAVVFPWCFGPTWQRKQTAAWPRCSSSIWRGCPRPGSGVVEVGVGEKGSVPGRKAFPYSVGGRGSSQAPDSNSAG